MSRSGRTIELKRTGTLPEAGNLKPKFWGSGGNTRPHVKIARGHLQNINKIPGVNCKK